MSPKSPSMVFHGDVIPTSKIIDPMEHACYVMRKIYGYAHLRDHQKEVLSCFLQGCDTLAILPTGGGKSMCYVLPAMMGRGLGVVVSPLIALIRDQVIQLRQVGVPAAALDSMQSMEQKHQVMCALKQGLVKLLFISPERLAQPSFQQFLCGLCVRFVAVDEAHCVSEWGADFRPEYRKLGEYFSVLTASIPRLALTATATKKVRGDIIQFLGLRSPKEIIKTPLRDNLKIRTQELRRKSNHSAKIMARIPRGGDEQGIIYTISRKQSEQLAARLGAYSLQTAAYHGGMNGGERDRVQKAFLQGELSLVVATNAFGLGINKKDIRFVHHYGLPMSLESYMQQIGRAGRDGKASECSLFFTYGDCATHKFMLEKNYPAIHRIQAMYACLCELLEKGRLCFGDFCSKMLQSYDNQEFSRCFEILLKEGVVEVGGSGSVISAQMIRDDAQIAFAEKGSTHMEDLMHMYLKRKKEAERRFKVMMQYAEAGKRREEVVKRYFVS